jgi:tetratricopeptide (TPR) repeat protein
MVEAYARQPEEPLFACNLGHYLEAAERWDEAQSAFADCLALSPSWGASPFWDATPWRVSALPQILERAEEITDEPDDLIIRAYRGLKIENPPDDPRAQVTVARALLLTGQEAAAVERLDRVLAQSPLNGLPSATAWDLRGQVYLTNGDPARAASCFQNSIYLEPTAEAYFHLGQAAESQHRPQEAIEHYRAAIAQAAASSISGFGPWVAHNLSLPQERLPCLITPRPYGAFAGPMLALSRLLEREGECAEAVRVCRMALSQAPYLDAVQERLDNLPCLETDP